MPKSARTNVFSALVVAACAAGCAGRAAQSPVRTGAGVMSGALLPAEMTLDQIPPHVSLGSSRPASSPSDRPPVEALALYARARGLLADNDRTGAAAELRHAAALDPDSYELHASLARALDGQPGAEGESEAELEKAGALDPDHLDVQLDLGRHYLTTGDAKKALGHLRLAALTTDYHEDGPRSPEADLFLARALQEQGYGRAALTQYEKLVGRVESRDPAPGPEGEVAQQVAAKLNLQIGDLYLRQGKPAAALAAYEKADRSLSHPTDWADAFTTQAGDATGGAAVAQFPADSDLVDVRARLVRTLLLLGREEDALGTALRTVPATSASTRAVGLLVDAYGIARRPGGALAVLKARNASSPDDRPILFALCDVMRSHGQRDEADHRLAAAQGKWPQDASIVRRRFTNLDADGDAAGAARLLIEAIAARPSLTGDLGSPILRLAAMTNRARVDSGALPPKGAISLDDVRRLTVSPGALAARNYVLSELATRWPRLSMARQALNDALAARTAFPPAYRQRLGQILADGALTDASRERAAASLVSAAESSGDQALSHELRGRLLLSHGDAAGATEEFTVALRVAAAEHSSGSPAAATSPRSATSPAAGISPANADLPPGEASASPELRLASCQAFRLNGAASGYWHLLRALIASHPAFDPARVAEVEYLRGRSRSDLAERGMASWLSDEPLNVLARLMHARDLSSMGQADGAEQVLLGLYEENGDDPAIIAALTEFAAQNHRTDKLIARFEQRVARRPREFQAAQALAEIYISQSHAADASRVLDAARAAAADEPDVLYSLSQLYPRIGQKGIAEEVLQQILHLEPRHSGANNDLGYAWAEQGKNLEQAEAMTRAAVDAEPENTSLLDSLGWVLYRRGRFEEARTTLERAIGLDVMVAVRATPSTPPAAATQPVAATQASPPSVAADEPAPAAPGDITDPVVLDHLGDVMYRLADRDIAGRLWGRSSHRLAQMTGNGGESTPEPGALEREDLRPLRLQLQLKQRQLKAGQPVTVAPVAEPPPATRLPTSRPAQAGLLGTQGTDSEK